LLFENGKTPLIERFLARISSSPYKNNFILKGGILLSNYLPGPNTDPLGAYQELTARLRNPTPENVSLDAILPIDHSLLKPFITDNELEEGYEVAKRYGVASVCVMPESVTRAAEVLNGSCVAVGAAIDFPFGRSATRTKVQAAVHALEDGATEIDMPINIGKMCSKDYKYVHGELKAVWSVVRERGAVFKPIARVDDLQTAWKNDPEYKDNMDNPYIVKYCQMVQQLQDKIPGGYHQIMLKTSTGFDHQDMGGKLDYEGATDEVLGIFAKVCPPGESYVGIKAAGKIRTGEDFLRIMKNFGVVRIGCTATEKVAGQLQKMGYVSHINPKGV